MPCSACYVELGLALRQNIFSVVRSDGISAEEVAISFCDKDSQCVIESKESCECVKNNGGSSAREDDVAVVLAEEDYNKHEEYLCVSCLTAEILTHSNNLTDNVKIESLTDNTTPNNYLTDNLTSRNHLTDNLTLNNHLADILTHNNNLTDNLKIENLTDNPIHITDNPSTAKTPHEDIQPATPSDDQKSNISSLPRKTKVILILLLTALFSAGCGSSLSAPFFPEEAAKKGISLTVTGLVFSSYEFLIFLSSPFYGYYLTKIGPKFMIVSGTLVGGACSILFGLLDRCPPGETFIILCLACRCAGALSVSAALISGYSIMFDEFPQAVATSFALLEMSDGIGQMVGPAVGGVLFQIGGYGLPFFVIGSMNLFVGMGVYFILPDSKVVKEDHRGSIASLLKHPMVWFSGLSIATCAMGMSFLDPTLAKHLEKFDLSTSIVGLMFMITPFLYAMTSPMWGRITDNMNINGTLITLGNLMRGLGLLIIGPSPLFPFFPAELWVIILGLVGFGSVYALSLIPTMDCLLIGAVELEFEDDLETYGVVVALFNSFYYLGSSVGPMLGGVLIEEMGFRAGATVISGIYFVVMISCGLYFLYRHTRPNPKQQTSVIDYGALRPKTETMLSLGLK